MSYESEILADAPAGYWRLDEAGSASDGDPIADLSGNGRDMTLELVPVTVGYTPFGAPTAIETDSSSYGFAAKVSAAGDRSWGETNDSAFNLGTVFTLEAWINSRTDVPTAGDHRFFGKNASYELVRKFNVNTPGADHYLGVVLQFSDLSTTTLLASSLVPYLESWYHVVVTRSGTSLALYVNGQLANSATISALSVRNSGQDLEIGNSNAAAPQDNWVDECAIFPTSLSPTRVLAHFEAAKLSLPIRATITVRASVTLDTSRPVPTDFGFSHNHAQAIGGGEVGITELLDYSTRAMKSWPDYEQRVNASPHSPARSYEYRVTTSAARQRAWLHSTLWSPGNQFLVPVWTDWGTLTGSASGTNVPTSTAYRDYDAGGYLCLFTDPDDPSTYEFRQIQSLTGSAITTTAAVAGTFNSGAYVAPARRATLGASLPVTSHVRDRETFALRFELLPEEVASNRLTAYTPAETFKSVEVFSLERVRVEWLDEQGYEIQRRAEGRKGYLLAQDTGSQMTIPVRFLLAGREALSEFYGWLDARQGRANPVWISKEESDLQVTARSATTITVQNAGYTRHYNLHSARRYIRIRQVSGTETNHEITAAVDNGTTETLTIDGVVPSLVNIERVSFLRYCRLLGDSIEIAHHRDSADVISECSLSFLELLTSPD